MTEYECAKIRNYLLERCEKKSNGCWQWLHRVNSKGYGQMAYVPIEGKRRTVKVHRMAYKAFIGPIPKGLLVCHTCDNPGCINPDHLFVGTPKDNTQDMMQKGRHVTPFVEGNFYGKPFKPL